MMDESGKTQEEQKAGLQTSILNELKRNNELLEALLSVQKNTQQRQKKFWAMAVAQICVLVIIFIWWGSKYVI